MGRAYDLLMNALSQQLKQIPPGTVIPKPEAKSDFTIKGWGKRRHEAALVYNIPNHSNPGKPYQKGVTLSEWEQAYKQLLESGQFTREWFDSNMQACSSEGGCNFTTIGGILSLLGLAVYSERGVYRKLR
jgi:hypothetical protein